MPALQGAVPPCSSPSHASPPLDATASEGCAAASFAWNIAGACSVDARCTPFALSVLSKDEPVPEDMVEEVEARRAAAKQVPLRYAHR